MMASTGVVHSERLISSFDIFKLRPITVHGALDHLSNDINPGVNVSVDTSAE